MSPVEKALWYVESHLGGDITLDEIAAIAGVSGFHLTRAFAEGAGIPLMRYVRARRLTTAAKALAAGARDILSVALEAGYGSHEAFTRAFRAEFARTPEQVRREASLHGLSLTEPLSLNEEPMSQLDPPRFEMGKPLLIAGLSERYNHAHKDGIPGQWQRFAVVAGTFPALTDSPTYGVCCNGDDEGNFDYVCGLEVKDFTDVANGLARLRIPAQRYAVFRHAGHVSAIRRTVNAIWNDWLPRSGHTVADAPNFERYGTDFDPIRGTGTIEIWLPLAT